MKTILINLKEIKPGKTTFSILSNSEDLELKDIEYELASKINTQINIYKNRNNYEMEIASIFDLRLICSRCLSEFIKQFNEISHFYLKEGKEDVEKEHTFSDEDAYTIFFSEESIDIAPIIREQVILSIPIKPLCSESCQLPSYKSEFTDIDPRWQKLMELKDKLNQ
ncbi:MAG: DUF177 domain-containing protein [candidate division WOR-3 bacterium]|nr:DUF177 domain-containing protein [candidate division WOR-3 bacterium]MCX7948024.1 DUF177 domain-containing protein [candidate division WOR-3 bacterium]MDW8151078.1 DUF177 domain-containing protein [candidate division WOR-3 bacterium]